MENDVEATVGEKVYEFTTNAVGGARHQRPWFLTILVMCVTRELGGLEVGLDEGDNLIGDVRYREPTDPTQFVSMVSGESGTMNEGNKSSLGIAAGALPHKYFDAVTAACLAERIADTDTECALLGYLKLGIGAGFRILLKPRRLGDADLRSTTIPNGRIKIVSAQHAAAELICRTNPPRLELKVALTNARMGVHERMCPESSPA